MEHQHHTQKYTCPMHPQIIKDDPGNCPLCGMQLVSLANHEKEHSSSSGKNDAIADFKRRFLISILLAVPVLLLSPMIQHWLDFRLVFSGSGLLLFFLSTTVFFYGGFPFLKGLAGELKVKNPGMMTLVGTAVSVAWIYSTAVMFGFIEGMDFYWEMATLVVIMLLGHWIEMQSIAGASKALELMVKMLPAEAHMYHGTTLHDMRVEELNIGDLVLVKPGEKVPVDGTVTDGDSFVDESMLTGESVPVRKSTGSKVVAGSINSEGSLKVRVDKMGKESYLNKIIALVQEAQAAKSQTQRLADRAARWLTFISIGVGVATLVVWLVKGHDLAFALERMVTVMVTSCPHALGIAIPLVVAISTAMSARNGLLIRDRTAFENARKITAMVFDKTGTLTEGKFGVSHIQVLNNLFTTEDLLAAAASLEQHSQHPIAQGIVLAAKEKHLPLSEVSDFVSITGKGVEGTLNGKKIGIVSPGYLKEKHLDVPEDLSDHTSGTVVYVLEGDKPVGYIVLADRIRTDAQAAVTDLKRQGIKVFMATGDNEKVGRSVAEALGLDGYYAEILPHQKVEIIKKLQATGEFVAMTGDGVNDAPALAQADIGIAIGSGTDVAAETADIILTDSRPSDVVNLVNFGKATYRKMIQNLFWATGYNLIAIPLAAGVLYPDFLLSPALGAVLMSASTVLVAANAQLLKLNKP